MGRLVTYTMPENHIVRVIEEHEPPIVLSKSPRQLRMPVIFIHGMWLHTASWRHWKGYFRREGYRVLAPGWPGFPKTVAEARMYPEFMHDLTIDDVVEYYTRIIRKLRRRPIVIGHCVGGLVALRLLDRRIVTAAIAIDPAPIKGVRPLPFSQIRSSWPVLGNPFAWSRAVSLKPKQFRYAFANRLPDREAAKLYERWSIPAPSRPLWEVVTANFVPHAQSEVNVNRGRRPLLLMTGEYDHVAPPETTRVIQRLYERSPSRTDLKEWPDRGHSLVVDHGWQEVAEYTRKWLRARRIG